MERKKEIKKAKGVLEPRDAQANSGQGLARVWLVNGEHRDYVIKNGVVNIDGIKIPARIIGDFLYDAGFDVVGVEYINCEVM